MSGAALLAGKKGVVVGVSSPNSIGHACARRLVDLGAEVVITHRRGAEEGDALAASSGAVRHVTLDVTDDRSIAEAFDQAASALGPFDFVVHSVMGVPDGVLSNPLVDVSRGDFAKVLDVGAYSLIAVARAAAPGLKSSGAGRIVTISSCGAASMTPGYHVAGIAKAALEAAAMYLAYELGKDNILCNVVSPGLVGTDGALRAVGSKNAEATRAIFEKKAPTRKAVELEDIADAVAWLVSPMARNVTAEVITLDGGYSRLYF